MKNKIFFALIVVLMGMSLPTKAQKMFISAKDKPTISIEFVADTANRSLPFKEPYRGTTSNCGKAICETDGQTVIILWTPATSHESCGSFYLHYKEGQYLICPLEKFVIIRGMANDVTIVGYDITIE